MTTMNGPVDIVVRGRHIELSQRFREHVVDKLGRVDRFGVTLSRVDVEVTEGGDLGVDGGAHRGEWFAPGTT